MNMFKSQWPHADGAARPVFDETARTTFAQLYPETPHALRHELTDHPLLTLDALADLAHALTDSSVEYNRGDVPIGVDEKPGQTGLSIAQTIRTIAKSNSWAVLKNIEQAPAYEALLGSLLNEIRPQIERHTGAMLTPQGFIFISNTSLYNL